MGEPTAGVVVHSVPLKSARVRIALLQLAGPLPIGKETLVIHGRPTLQWKSTLVADRIARATALVEALSRCEPRPDIIIFPEYTTPLTAEAISGLQAIADGNDIIIISGADNETPRSAQGRQRITQSVVIIPRAEPAYVEKRKLSVWELEKGRVDEPTDARLHAFAWKVGDASYWFSVQVCIDFLHFAADPPEGLLKVPGTDALPIFLSLSNRHLRDVERLQLGGTLAQVIASNRGVATDTRQVKTIQRTVDELIDSRRLLILFDGIDEALTADRAELVTFLKQLHESGLRYVLTSRLEYSPFFDVGRQVFPAGHLAVVELTDWGPNQWPLYVNALGEELPEQRHLVDRFARRLASRHYANLPARPLFLRMLADLEARNDTGIIINERLSGNLSEVYFKFISWKVMDDYKRKGGVEKFDAGAFRVEAFGLLSQLAAVEYKRGRTGQEDPIRLSDVSRILALGEFHELTDHVIEALLHSSLFSILRRSGEKAFQFSHKSFMEYLVAHLYAATIFASPGDPSKSTCTGVWDQYQTYEVSQHFLREVERIRVSANLTEARVLDHFREAFVAALRDDALADSRVLDERIQSVLYYAGRLRLWDDQIQSKLHSILANPDSHHKIYRRTASIALGILESPKYIDEYAFFLLNHSSERDSDFDLNLSISKGYYGVPGVERVLREDLEKFLLGAERSPILSLRLLTYWAYMLGIHGRGKPKQRPGGSEDRGRSLDGGPPPEDRGSRARLHANP
ncbi:MAG: NACHT domain-containing protein [Gammaproteobacteria bacterium]